jgi:hypothetical protein
VPQSSTDRTIEQLMHTCCGASEGVCVEGGWVGWVMVVVNDDGSRGLRTQCGLQLP